MKACLILIAILFSVNCHAMTESCDDRMTIAECWTSLFNGESGNAESNVERQHSAFFVESQGQFNALPVSSALPGLASTLNDVVPLYSLLGVSGLSGGQIEDYLGGAFKPVQTVNGLVGVYGNANPELLGPLKQGLRNRGSGERVAELEEGLDLTDDLLFEYRAAPSVAPYFGRDWKDYEPVYGDLLTAITPGQLAVQKAQEDYQSCFAGPILQLKKCHGDARCEKIKATCSAVMDTTVGQVRANHPEQYQLFREFVAAAMGGINQIQAGYLNNELDKFADLLHNQPQINFSAQYFKREDTVNAGRKSLKVGFESGLANLAIFKLRGSKELDKGAKGSCIKRRRNHPDYPEENLGWSQCVQEFGNYVDDNRWLIEHAVRVRLGYEYSDIDDISVELPFSVVGNNLPLGADGFVTDSRFEVPGTRRDKYTAGIGAVLIPPGDKHRFQVRADMNWEKEKHRNDLYRNDRELFTVTVTVQNGDLSIPINLIYKDDSEFRQDVEVKDLTAMVGLRWDILPEVRSLPDKVTSVLDNI